MYFSRIRLNDPFLSVQTTYILRPINKDWICHFLRFYELLYSGVTENKMTKSNNTVYFHVIKQDKVFILNSIDT